MSRAVLALAGALAIGCFSPGLPAPERRVQAVELLEGPITTIVYDPRAHLAVVTLADALTFSTGFEGGEALRSRLGLGSPAAGFAQALAEALRAQPRFASTDFAAAALPDVAHDLAARGAAPVLSVGVAEWRLVLDLSLQRYRLVLGLWASITPAWMVASRRAGMAFPDRLWRDSCTSRGPDPTLPMDRWLAEDGAVLRAEIGAATRRCAQDLAERLARFVETGEE